MCSASSILVLLQQLCSSRIKGQVRQGTNPLSDHMIHTVLMKVDKHGIPQWITYMESQFEMVANDILVDASVRPPRIMIAGIFKGYYPRLYNVNPSTKRAKRGESKERGGGIRCNDPSQIGNLAECWYFQGTPNLQTPKPPKC